VIKLNESKCTVKRWKLRNTVIDYNWNHWSTPWNRAVLENIIAVKVFEELLSFYGTPIFIIVLISARHWSLFWARVIQSIPLCLMFLSSVLILLSLHFPLAVPRVLCLSGTSIEIFWIFCVFHACYIHVCYHTPNFTALRISGEQWKSWSSCLCSCIPPSLWSTLSSQHPVIPHHQSLFFLSY
jgi:hypothetical protein